MPAQVGTNVRSVTHSWFGAVAVKSRPTRSGCRGSAGSGRVVRTRLVRRTPSIPAARISRATWSRPTSWPARRAAFQIFRAP